MQELAQSLYDSTPGLQDGIPHFPLTSLVIPRESSKILSTAKKPTTTATMLLGDFDRKGFNGAGDTYLRKVDKKELSKFEVAQSISRGRCYSRRLGDEVQRGVGKVQEGEGRD